MARHSTRTPVKTKSATVKFVAFTSELPDFDLPLFITYKATVGETTVGRATIGVFRKVGFGGGLYDETGETPLTAEDHTVISRTGYWCYVQDVLIALGEDPATIDFDKFD